ncbi:MAG: hypothetical protein M1817_002899 [Caeruleum heppii]|nr:MAG: hypothetical protein M1817_002899 [Caeruleum heppii]
MTSVSQTPAFPPQATGTSSTAPNPSATHSSTSSISGTSANLAAVPAAATARSYASATKKPFSPPLAAGSNGPTPPAVVGGAPSAAQPPKSDTDSPVNVNGSVAPAGNTSSRPTVVNSSTVVNGTSGPAPHSRKSSITISAAGASGQLPNGGPVAGPAGSRPIKFGFSDGSPAAAHSVPQHHQPADSLPLATPNNPRVTSPQSSPSPIPQPAASGGRPPSALQGQSNPMSFGSLPVEHAMESNRQTRPGSMSQGPLMPGPQEGHIRRESSHSSHSDVGNAGLGMGPGRGGYPPPGGRGRGYGQQYPQHQQMGYPPGPGFRGAPNQPRGGHPMGSQFQGQGGPMGPYPNSPHRTARSPGLTPSVPGTPNMQQQIPMANSPMQNSHYGAYPPNMGPAQAPYGMPQHFDAGYSYYPPGMYSNMYMSGQPASPRPPYQQHVHGGQQPYVQGQYGQPQPAPMSRTSSAVSEQRPGSSLGKPQTPSMNAAAHASTQPAQGRGSPAPAASNFVRPPRKSAGIVIKDPNTLAVKTFDKAPASPASSSRSPAIVSSTPTPPPSRPAEPQHSRSESKSVKTNEEKKNDMRDAIAKKIEADKAAEQTRKDQADEQAAKEKADLDKVEKEAAEQRQREEEAAELAKKQAAEEHAARERAAAQAAEDEAKAQEEARRERERAEQAKEEEARQAKAQEAEQSRQAAEDEATRVQAEKAEKADVTVKANTEAASEASATDSNAPSTPAGLAAGLAKMSLASGTSTPGSDDSTGPPTKPTSSGKRAKPAELNLAPLKTKDVEPPQPSAALQALRSARFIDRIGDVSYPGSIASPNPALNQTVTKGKFKYDKDFLLQFQPVFTEKPSVNWETQLKDTVGDTSDSARPQTARTPSMGPRNTSGRPGVSGAFTSMGTFGQGRTLPPGTTSDQRFAAANGGGGMNQARPATMNNPLAPRFAGIPGGMTMGSASMSRTTSSNTLHLQGGAPHSPGGGKGGSKRDSKSQRQPTRDRQPSKREEEQAAKTMPMTAGMEIKPLLPSTSGWKPRSIAGAASATGAAGPTPGASGHMEPDMVQRKVKSNLNKMTPEKFEKIADQILEIAAQSKDESDGRTLRQVIQLTFEKATDEAHWASMYAKFCKRMLESMSAEIKDESIRDKNGNVVTGGNLFRKYLLNRCQEEFERGWKLNLPEKPEGETEEAVMLSEEYYIAAAAKRRGLGLVQFIGELYKLGMLTERIMHECVKKLVDYEGIPDEAEVEGLTKLLRTIGANLDSTEKGPQLMDVYFKRIKTMVDTPDLPSRLRFMLMDIIDLRKKNWESRTANKGPQTIQEIRDEAARQLAEKEAEKLRQQSQRHHGGGGRMAMGRGDARSFSGGGQYGLMAPPEPPRNTVGMDDLRRLGNRAGSRQMSQGPVSLGPTSMFNSRSSSGRKAGLGPVSGLARGEESGGSSRTATPPATKEVQPSTSANAFSALASLDASEAAEAPSAPSSPPTTRVKPSATNEEASSKAPSTERPAGSS